MNPLRARIEAGPRFLSTLDQVTQWPLWSLKKYMFGPQQRVWVFMADLTPYWLKPDGARHMLEELRRLEATIQEEGIIGWMTSIDFDNWRVIRTLEMVGAKNYHKDDAGLYYQKSDFSIPLPSTTREVVTAWRTQREALQRSY